MPEQEGIVMRPRSWPVIPALLAVTVTGGVFGLHSASAHALRYVTFCTHNPAHPYRTYLVYFRDRTRIRANAWGGHTGSHKYCLTTNGVYTTIDTSARPAGNVVAYPSSETGPMFTWTDRQSDLPIKVTRLNRLTYNVGVSGHASGVWLADVDAWFRPRMQWTGHGTAELVVANRWWSGEGRALGKLVWIHRVPYRFRDWITGDNTGKRWPIFVFRKEHPSRRNRVMVGRFTYYLRKHRLWPRNARWYQDGAYGVEVWSGGKGLTFWKTISHEPKLRHRRLAGSRA
jgi:hypothetical protein